MVNITNLIRHILISQIRRVHKKFSSIASNCQMPTYQKTTRLFQHQFPTYILVTWFLFRTINREQVFTIKAIKASTAVIPIFKFYWFQNKVKRCTVNALWYVLYCDLHRNVNVEIVTDNICTFEGSYQNRIQNHRNFKAFNLLKMNSQVLKILWYITSEKKKPLV